MTQENATTPLAQKRPDQVWDKIRFKHRGLSTEKTYISWSKHYIALNGKRHPVQPAAIPVVCYPDRSTISSLPTAAVPARNANSGRRGSAV